MREYESIDVVHMRHSEIEVGCNKCGETTQLTGEEHERERTKEEYSEIRLSFGYGSSFDSENWSFDLCENCLRELIKNFKIVPRGFGEDSYYAHYPQTMFEEWKETGVINLEAGMTPEEIETNGGSIYSDNYPEEEDENEED